jgi:hypothetical protein
MKKNIGQVVDKRMTSYRIYRGDLLVARFEEVDVLRVEAKSACGEEIVLIQPPHPASHKLASASKCPCRLVADDADAPAIILHRLEEFGGTIVEPRPTDLPAIDLTLKAYPALLAAIRPYKKGLDRVLGAQCICGRQQANLDADLNERLVIVDDRVIEVFADVKSAHRAP